MSLFEEIEALKPDGIKMSAFIAQLVEAGMKKPSVHEERATREVQINRFVHGNTHDAMIAAENDKAQDVFHLNHGNITFNEIIEKHKVELEKKYK